MGIGHTHSHARQERSLFIALLLTATFMVVETIGGILTHSLALLSDAAHMLTDVAALVISFMAIKISQRRASPNKTFGYYRIEILAAIFNTILLFLAACYIVFEAYQRWGHPPEIDACGMIIIAIFGLIINLISMRFLLSDKDHSLNIKSAYLEVWSDMLGSVGVILAAITLYFTTWKSVDSLIAILIGLWILPRAFILLRDSIHILLEGVPREINLDALKQKLSAVEGVSDIHELHVWAISSDKISLTAHVVVDPNYNPEVVSKAVHHLVNTTYHISHVTLQTESVKCLEEDQSCHFR